MGDFSEISGKGYVAREIPAKDAREIVKRYHYSGKVVSNSKHHVGIFNHDGELVGALQYGPSMNGSKTGKKFHDTASVVELNRMVMADSEPRNAESQAISLANKWMKHNTQYDYVLSFSDGKEGNCGYIYQATNWIYVGYLLSTSFYDLDGAWMHSVSVWHKFKEKHPKRDTHTTNQILCEEFESVSVVASRQHIYLMPLRKGVKFKTPAHEYPKMDKEKRVVWRRWLKRDGVECDEKEVFDPCLAGRVG